MTTSPSTCRAWPGRPRSAAAAACTCTAIQAGARPRTRTSTRTCCCRPRSGALWQPCTTCRRRSFPRLDCPRTRRWSAATATSLCSTRPPTRSRSLRPCGTVGRPPSRTCHCGVSRRPPSTATSRNAACRLIADRSSLSAGGPVRTWVTRPWILRGFRPPPPMHSSSVSVRPTDMSAALSTCTSSRELSSSPRSRSCAGWSTACTPRTRPSSTTPARCSPTWPST